MDRDWARTGRLFAWAYGALLIVAGVLVTIVSIGIPPTAPDLAKHYAYVRQIWPELYISFLLFMAAFVCLIVIAVVLREFFGRGLSSELLYTSFLAAALVGMIWMLAQIGSAQVVVRDSPGMSPQDLNVLGASSSIWSAVINWLQRGYLRHSLDRAPRLAAAFAPDRPRVAQYRACGLLLAGPGQPRALRRGRHLGKRTRLPTGRHSSSAGFGVVWLAGLGHRSVRRPIRNLSPHT